MDCFALSKRHRFIGIFDTGAGGLNVLKACRALHPNENYLYFADNLNAPYGGLDETQIRGLTLAAGKRMETYGLKALVLACNTATGAAAEALRKELHFPVIGMEPAVKPAAAVSPDKEILLLCTPATARHDKLKNLIKTFGHKKITVLPQKDWAAEIEGNLPCRPVSPAAATPREGNSLYDRIKSDLGNLGNIGAVVLGCTHYIFIKDMIAEICGGAPVFDGVDGTVKNLFKRIGEIDLLNQSKEKGQVLIVTTAPTKMSYWNTLLNSE